ncbi:helix-turn-helix transcriptional regulator [Lentzea sp. NEAU-D7]|uniref:helix-turn-helix transcriptional regulator n=1 Tax=Lentzea sp. NEAU-D7 TaxID=2994667 RepID=UPI00224AA608|nr:LuxR C-terminal-related transcriptional regulator [Lentzea sp. NEAU-D7]MCX2949255.1 LuxR C-terminal-related transcriptional regulator [Lentzea sp. NEAU-D7]
MWWSVDSRTRLVGRERELTTVRRLLRRHRLVTLVGPGGAGKSRLAAELRLGDAVVELESVRRPDLLWHVIAFSLNVWEEPDSPLHETVRRALADHRVLVLDNCEHLIREAASAVAELLAACPRLRVLVTSREPLDLAGEMCVEIGPLSPADARHLFVECGGAVELADSVRDHLPLAIELAAARTDVPARHRTLDAVIGWSYDLLSPAERSALRRLSALIGDFDLNLAAAVCGEGADVVQLMASLRAKSLVVRSPSSSSARFRMLESIRLFGLARLEESGEAETTFDLLVDSLTATIRSISAAPVITSAMDTWLTSQEHQLLQAVERVPRTDPRHTWLVAGVVHVWYLHRSYSEALRMASTALAHGPLTSHAELLLFRAAWLAGFTGDEVAALRYAEALVAHPAMSQPAWEARGWNTLGYARGINSDLAGAHTANERSVAAARSLGDPELLMTFLNNHAWLLMRLDDLTAALAAALESLSLGVLDGFRLMASRHTAGVIALAANDVDQAEHHFTIALQVGAPAAVSEAGLLEGLGIVAEHRGDADRAVVLMAAAAATRRTRGSQQEEPWNRMVADARERALSSAGPRRASRAWSLGERLDHAGLLAYVSTPRQDGPLTARQREIADLVADGLTNTEIAVRLGISVATVRSHVTQMLSRLGLSSRTQLAARTARTARTARAR